MTGGAPVRPDRAGSFAAWRRRAFSPVGWAVFLVTIGTSVTALLTLPGLRGWVGPGDSLAVVTPIVAALTAGVLAGFAAAGLALLWEVRLGEPRGRWSRGGQIFASMLAGTVALARLFEAFGVGRQLHDTFPLIALTTGALALAAWWIADGLSRDWRLAAAARDRLTRALAETSELNGLLAVAERERFDSQARSIELRLGDPVRRLAERGRSLTPDELATELERLVNDVMRPLAHLMHPVAVRTGLVPAIRALGATYRLAIPADLAAADAAGTLLADDVRLQVYRWIRHLEPAVSGGVIELTIRASDGGSTGALVVEVRGAREASREVDPIGRVAGLVGVGHVLRAPLSGTDAAPVDETPSADAPRRNRPSWRLLATPPALNLPFIALISLMTTSIRFYPTTVPFGPGLAAALAISGTAPVVAAIVLRRLPAPTAPRAAAAWSSLAWTIVALVAGLATWSVTGLVFAEVPPGQSLGVQLGRGLVRHLPGGLAYQLARGAAAQAEADGRALEAALGDANARRSRLLARAESIERSASETLHRTAQGRLTAAAALARMGRVDEALREVAHVRDVTLPAIAGLLSSVDLDLDPSVGDDAPGAIVQEDRVDWAEVGATHPLLASPLRRVIDECVVNAQRHGDARRVEIDLAEDDGGLRLVCRDDGRGLAADRPTVAGLGSRLFDEMCDRFGGSWSIGPRTDGAAGAEFVLTVPLGRA